MGTGHRTVLERLARSLGSRGGGTTRSAAATAGRDPRRLLIVQVLVGALLATSTLVGVRAAAAFQVEPTNPGVVSGTVVDSITSASLEGICVYVYGAATGSFGQGVTGASGGYEIVDLLDDDYWVYAFDCNSDGRAHGEQYYGGVEVNTGDAPVNVAGTSTTPSPVDFVLVDQNLGVISGTVVDSITSASLEGICVYVYGAATGSFGQGVTGASGGYEIVDLLDDDYWVYAFDCNSDGRAHGEQYYGGVEVNTGDAPVNVAGTSTTPSPVDFVLVDQNLGVISGTVVDSITSASLEGICVYVYGAATGSFGQGVTGASGGYEIVDLLDDDYWVYAFDCNSDGRAHGEQYYGGVEVNTGDAPVNVAGTSTTPSPVDFVLVDQNLGVISGTVVDSITSASLEGICVYVYGAATGSFGQGVTGASGGYEIVDLLDDDYWVYAFDCNSDGRSHFDQYYLGAVAYSADPPPVNVAGQTTTPSPVDFALVDQFVGSIGGTVVDSVTTSPLEGICVEVYGTTTSFAGSDITGVDGMYEVPELADDDYWVYAYDCNGDEQVHFEQYYAGVETYTGEAPVNVAGQTTTPSPVNFALLDQANQSSDGSIVGRVTITGTATPIAGICVEAFGVHFSDSGFDQTDAAGDYQLVGLVDDDYKLHFFDCVDSVYVEEWYDEHPDPFSAPLELIAISGGNQRVIDEDLAEGASISGTVSSDLTSGPVGGICVEVLDPTGTEVRGSDVTSGDGTYLVGSLRPEGNLLVRFRDCTRNRYVTEFHDDAAGTATATPVDLAAGQAVTIDASLFVENTAPVAVDDALEVYKQGTAILEVTNNDTDADGDHLTVVSAAVTDAAAFGTVLVEDGQLSYTPNVGTIGQVDTFDYTVDDGFGGTDTALVSVSIVDCPDLTPGLDDSGLVTGYEWVECAGVPAHAVVGEIASHFTPVGGTSGLMTSGRASEADQTPADFASTGLSGQFTRGAFDVSVLRLDLDLPTGTECLALDVSFLSEEYPEYVGQSFNDAFIAELDANTWTTSGSDIIAPDNFAFAPSGEALSINSVFFDPSRVVTDSGTVYDGGTARLRIQTPTTPGAHSLYLSIFDQADNIFDSAAFVDALRAESDPSGTCQPGANAAPVAVDDDASTDEDTAVVIDVVANDTDGDADTLRAVDVGNPPHGTAIVLADGRVRYTPDQDFFGLDEFIYTVGDPSSATDTATVTMTVSPVNDAPVADDVSASVAEDAGPVTVVVSGSDVELDALTFALTTQPDHGVVTSDDGDDELVYTPDADFHGVDTFTYVADDGALQSSPATVTVTVTPTNDAPTAVDDNATTAEDTPVSIDVLANDTDPDLALGDDTFTVTAVGPGSHGTTQIIGGEVVYTPAPDYHGSDSFTYTMQDAAGASSDATVDVTVTPVNDAPVAADVNTTTDEDTAVVVTLSASDVDGDALTYQIVSGPTDGTLSGAIDGDASVTYTPDTDSTGVDAFTFRAFDGALGSGTGTVTVTVSPVNDAPTADDQTVEVGESTPTDIVLTGDDIDGDALTFGIASGPSHGTLSSDDGDAGVTYTPDADYAGPDAFTFTTSDGDLSSTPATVSIEVVPNTPPTAANQAVTTAEDSSLDVDVSASDPDNGQTLTYAIATQPSHGSVTVVDGDTFRYSPDQDYNGPDQFTFTASDGLSTSAPATVQVSVTPVNDAPEAADATYDTDEDTPLDVVLQAGDVEGDPLTFAVVDGPSNGTLSGTDDGDATVTYTPDADFNGEDSFTFRVNDGTADSAVATATIVVAPTADAPVAGDLLVVTDEDTPVVIVLPATDADGDTLTYTITSGPGAGTLTGVDDGDAAVTYTPNADANGVDGFTFRVSDGTTTDDGTVTVSVAAVNDAPEAASATYDTDEDTALDVVLQAGDVEGDPLTFAVVDGPSNGTLSGTGDDDDTVTYTPDADFNGEDSFTFRVNDGTADSAVATATIVVAPVDDAPVAGNVSVSTAEDTSKSIVLLGSDVDGDALTYTITSNPTTGTLTGRDDGDANVVYTPPANFHGVVSFTYEVSDGTSSDGATVTVTVAPVNDAPTAAAGSLTVAEDTPGTVALVAADVDGDVLTYAVVTGPANGTVTITGNQARYTPSTNFAGSDSFTFRASDGSATSPVRTVTVTVTPVNDAPTADDGSATVVAGQSVEVTLSASDIEGDPLSYTIVDAPSSGTLSAITGNVVTYTAGGQAGTVTFTFRASDASATSNVATVTVEVAPATTTSSATGTIGDGGGTISTAGGTATADNETVTSVTSPVPGDVTILERDRQAGAPSGYRYFGEEIVITAPTASVEAPLVLEFRIHESAVPGGTRTIRMFRNGRLVPLPCVEHDVDGDGSADPFADPDPCSLPIVRDGEEYVVTIYTSRASTWNFAEATDEAPVDAAVDRLAGDDRIRTAVAISADAFATADTVVLARSDAYPDALAGAPLAASLDAPMLLTTSGGLDPAVAEEIERLGATRAVLLGGEVALGEAVESALTDLGIDGDDVTRFAGSSRFDTAALVARDLGGTSVYITEGVNPDPARGWPDAVAVSALAAFQERPILLVTAETLPEETAAALAAIEADEATIIGGEVAVSPAVAAAIGEQVDAVARIFGGTRYDTSAAVAAESVRAGLDPSRTWFATGRNFPDAMAAGSAVAADGGVLLLTRGETLDETPSTVAWLAEYAPSMTRAVLVGGPSALSEAFESGVSAAVR